MGPDSSASESGSLEESGSVEQDGVEIGDVKVWRITEENRTISNELMPLILKRDYPRLKGIVETITGPTERVFVPIMVRPRNPTQMLMDSVTGTLYTMEGRCMSSNTRRIVRMDHVPL